MTALLKLFAIILLVDKILERKIERANKELIITESTGTIDEVDEKSMKLSILKCFKICSTLSLGISMLNLIYTTAMASVKISKLLIRRINYL